MKGVLEMSGGDGFMTLRMHLIPLNCTFLNVLDGNFNVLYILSVPCTQSCPTVYDPVDCSTPGFPVHHQLPELAQTHVHQVSDAIFYNVLKSKSKDSVEN